MDDDLLLVGEAQSVLTDERDSEGYAVHGLFPTRPVNKFILSLQRNSDTSSTVCCRYISLTFHQFFLFCWFGCQYSSFSVWMSMKKKDETRLLCLKVTYQTLVVRQHNNNLSVMVPNHPPEVCGGVGQRMLGNDELITPVVTLRWQRWAVNLLKAQTNHTAGWIHVKADRYFSKKNDCLSDQEKEKCSEEG